MENVKDLLKEMKNIVSLMWDLANASLLYSNKRLAEEVLHLQKQVNKKYEKIIEHLFKARLPSEEIIPILIYTDFLTDLANNISGVSKLETHKLIQTALEESKEKYFVGKAKKSIGKKIKEIPGKVIAILREERIILNPKKDLEIKEGDQIIAIVNKEEWLKLKENV